MKIGEIKSPGSSSSFPIFVGPIVYEVLAVCPTREELHKLGRHWVKEETNVPREVAGSKVVDVLFVLKAVSPEAKGQIVDLKFPIWEDDLKFPSGSYSVINKYGGTCAFKDGKPLSDRAAQYYDDIDSRPAKRNEAELCEFIARWAKTSVDDASGAKAGARLENMGNLFKGNFKELKELEKMVKAEEARMGEPYTVVVLTGGRLNNNNYKEAVTYNKKFYSSAYNASRMVEDFEKFIGKNQYNAFILKKEDVYYTMNISEYDPSREPTPSANPAPNIHEQNMGTEFAEANTSPGDDDLPF